MPDTFRRPRRCIDLGPLTLGDVLNIVELRTKIVSVSSFALGTLLAVWHTASFDWVRFLIMFVAVLAVDMGTTGFNSFFDLQSGVDHAATNLERDKVLVHRGVAPGAAFVISVGCFAVAVLLGLVLGIIVGPEIILVGVVAMSVGFLYTGGPRPISASPFGELFAGGFLGWFLVVLSYYVQTTTVSVGIALAALPSLIMVAAILAVNNACDIIGDRAAGRRTLSVLFGPGFATLLVFFLLAAGFIVLAAVGWAGLLPRAALVTSAVGASASLPAVPAMQQRGFSHATKGVSMRSVGRIFVIFTAAAAVSIVWGILR